MYFKAFRFIFTAWTLCFIAFETFCLCQGWHWFVHVPCLIVQVVCFVFSLRLWRD